MFYFRESCHLNYVPSLQCYSSQPLRAWSIPKGFLIEINVGRQVRSAVVRVCGTKFSAKGNLVRTCFDDVYEKEICKHENKMRRCLRHIAKRTGMLLRTQHDTTLENPQQFDVPAEFCDPREEKDNEVGVYLSALFCKLQEFKNVSRVHLEA